MLDARDLVEGGVSSDLEISCVGIDGDRSGSVGIDAGRRGSMGNGKDRWGPTWGEGDRCRSVDSDDNSDDNDDDNNGDDDKHGIDDGSSGDDDSHESSGVDKDRGNVDSNNDRNHNDCDGGDNSDDNNDGPFVCLMGGSNVSTPGSAQESLVVGWIEGVVGVRMEGLIIRSLDGLGEGPLRGSIDGGGRVVGSAWKVRAAVEEIMIVKITARHGRDALHALA